MRQDVRGATAIERATPALTPLAAAIVQTITYVDLFDYPLTPPEIHRYLVGMKATPDEVERALADGRLVPDRLARDGDYVMLRGRETIAATRRRRWAAAQRLWPAARRYGRAIAALPFVRMVAVTGSLAVDNIDREADIDYLIVTENDRLWLTRALVILVVRQAARLDVHLCPNYFLAERALAFTDHTLYAAREIAQMVLLSGRPTYNRLREDNVWMDALLPNATGLPPGGSAGAIAPAAERLSPTRRATEHLLRTPLGGALERWEMTRKIRKFNGLRQAPGQPHAESEFGPDWCKGHFNDHAQRILEHYQNALEELAPQ